MDLVHPEGFLIKCVKSQSKAYKETEKKEDHGPPSGGGITQTIG
jgi:hypothetical protein